LIQKQKIELNLKIGDFAYLVSEYSGRIEKVCITGDCDEGYGYTGTIGSEEIHTCNSYLTESLKKAKRKSTEILKKEMLKNKKEQSRLSKNQIFYEYWIWRGGYYDPTEVAE
jgi:hypothetical protein